MSIVISNAFKVIEGRPVTSSRIVAEYFGKQHHHVVRDIRSLIEQKPSLGKLFKNPRAKPDGTKMFCSAFLNDARMCCFFANAIVKY